MANKDMPTKVITGIDTRWSYLNVWEPKSINGSKPKYSVSLIIPKSDTETIAKINKAIQIAYKDGAGTLRGTGRKVPDFDSIWNPLRDGDAERSDDPAYADSYFVTAKSDTAPGIVDTMKRRITDTSEIYSGCYGRASVNFFAFNTNGNKGIACGLNHLQKVRDGERLGGRSSVEDDFDDLDFSIEDDDDFLN